MFDELYKLVGKVVVPLTWPTLKGIKIGDANPPVCRFCGQRSARAEARPTDSHHRAHSHWWWGEL